MSGRDQDKPLRAVVLAYSPQDDLAPRLVGKGQGELAERLIAKAKEHGLPIHKDPQLVRLLMKMDLEESIPPALYVAVAQVLALVWRAEADQAGRPSEPPKSPG